MNVSIKDIINKKTLVIGPVRSGKTRLLSHIVKMILDVISKDDILILDFSPSGSPNIGGPLSQYLNTDNINYIHVDGVRAPRLEGRDDAEVLRLAEENNKFLDVYINIAIRSSYQVIIINDITLYLHKGDFGKIVKLIKKSNTFIATAYYGDNFDDKGSGLNSLEKTIVERLMDIVNKVIKLGD